MHGRLTCCAHSKHELIAWLVFVKVLESRTCVMNVDKQAETDEAAHVNT